MNGQRPQPELNWPVRTSLYVLLVTSSFVAALPLRYVWRRVLGSATSDNFAEFLETTQLATGTTFLGAVVIGAIVLVIDAFRQRREIDFPFDAPLLLLCFYSGVGIVAYFERTADSSELLRLLPLAGTLGLAGQASFRAVRNSATRVRRRPRLRPLTLVLDAGAIGLSAALAYFVRFDGWPPEPYGSQLVVVGPLLVASYLMACGLWGVNSFIWQFTSLKETLVIAQATASAATVLLLLRLTVLPDVPRLRVPLGVLLVLPIFVFVLLMSMRVLRRVLRAQNSRNQEAEASESPLRVLLVGAGSAGQQLLRELDARRDVVPIGFIDDDPAKCHRRIHGLEVLGQGHELEEIAKREGIDQVILSMPSADPSAVLRIVMRCEKLGLPAFSVPSFAELAMGKNVVSNLRPVRMDDLLGRASLAGSLGDSELRKIYFEKRILITGAAGSIGSELARQLVQFEPASLILLDRDENGLYEISLELRDEGYDSITEVICDVRERERLARAFGKHRPDVVFHAAAFKHVPLMEQHPSEAIRNNVGGSQNIIELAREFSVARFVLVSTDKAVNPTSVMGASKRVAELILQQEAQRESDTRYCCVRFGNVLGSRASVVPLFQRQIRQKRRVTVTHVEVTRYFMTIPEAVQLVVQAGSLGVSGEVFLLDMGDPVKIIDLATDLIELSGLVPYKDVQIEFTGLRPGEKLREELLIATESGVRDTRFPKIFVATSESTVSREREVLIRVLTTAANAGDDEAVRQLLSDLQIGYLPTPGSVEAAPG